MTYEEFGFNVQDETVYVMQTRRAEKPFDKLKREK